MGSRLQNWIDRDTQVKEAELDILYDQVVSVDVFRVSEAGDNPGVTDEVDDAIFIRTINVRLDPPKYKADKIDFLGMTDDPDVLINDMWRWTPPRGSSVTLTVKKTTYAPSGAAVELSYV